MKRRIVSVLLALVMLLSLVPTVAFAGGHDGQVRVIVENTTFTAATEDSGGREPAWTGKLVDKWVDLTHDSTMMSCIVDALSEGSYSQTGAEDNYISEINYLVAFEGGPNSGWMMTLNDWFINEGAGAFTVSNGKLKEGDEIRVLYTCELGEDLGGSWGNTDKTVKAIAVSGGSISPSFSPDTHAYTLTLGEDVSAVTVTPTASNKNYQVRTSVNGKEYQRTAAIPVSDGTVITVTCGDKSWPTMNDNAGDAQTYKLTVSGGAPEAEVKGYLSDLYFSEKNTKTTASKAKLVMTPAFDQNTFEYTVTVPTAQSKLYYFPTLSTEGKDKTIAAAYKNTSGEEKSVTVKSGAALGGNLASCVAANTDVGNVVRVVVGDQTYLIHLVRPTVLSGLSIDAGAFDVTMDPKTFKAETLAYSAKIPADVKPVLTFSGMASNYLRYSTDGGENWIDLPSGGGQTAAIPTNVETVLCQVADKTADWTKAVTYSVTLERMTANLENVTLLGAECAAGFYPSFSKENKDYNLVWKASMNHSVTFTVPKKTNVYFDGDRKDTVDGVLTVDFDVTKESQTLELASGGLSLIYTFHHIMAGENAPDAVVDYLVINSQYTNSVNNAYGNFGLNPEVTLAATDGSSAIGSSVKSLGNFGGYITYYYEDPIQDDPRNKYGMDFYVYGNANKDTSTGKGNSFFEPGQVWVSEDGKDWYALAGSAHYEPNVDWNYTVTYTKTADGKTAWTDNHGNDQSAAAGVGAWPLASNYYMNGLSKSDTIVLSGICLPTEKGDLVSGKDLPCVAGWGYADMLPNGTLGADVNPYVDNSDYSSRANGFDLKWAVDADGLPVTVNNVHYIKVVTASNIWIAGVNEKSTEVQQVLRTVPQSASVGTTALPDGITVGDGSESVPVELKEGQTVYDVNCGDMTTVSVKVDTAKQDDHVFINNRFASGGTTSEAFALSDTARLVRVIVQNGDSEPSIVLLKLKKAKQAAVDAVIDAIADIGTVTLDSKGKIDAARTAYNALTDELKTGVTNYATLTDAESAYATLKADKDAVDAVIDAIADIGTVTLDSKGKIDAARTAYNALTDELKTKVTNYATLTDAESAYANIVRTKANDIYTAVGNSLLANAEKSTPVVNSIGGEWMILGLARSGKLTDEAANAYYANVTKTVKGCGGVLDKRKYTEYSRVVLALTAADFDPTNVAGYDLTAPLTDFNKTVWQGNNGTAFGLLALNSHDYHSDNTAIRQQYVDELLNKQLENGGWYITSGSADPDMTAMAIQALAPYYATNDSVKAAVDKALTFLSEKQGADGDYGSSETCAQVVVALSALGIDAAADRRFIKGGTSVLEALCGYYAEDATYGKGFAHVKENSGSYVGGAYNGMATEQGYYALTAYHRFKEAQTALYDMSDVCAGQHSYGAWTVTKAASCTENGSRSRTCSACGKTETETITALGHKLTKAEAKAPACTVGGNNEYFTCTVCSKVFKDAGGKQETTAAAETLSALGHNWSNATCTAPKACRTCGLMEGTSVAHSYNEKGICTVCGGKDPMSNVKMENVKVSADNDKIIADDSGLVIKATESVNQAKLKEIKLALTTGSTVIEKDAANTKEISAASNDTEELAALAEDTSLTEEQRAEVERLAEKLTSMQTDSTRKNKKVEMVLDLSVNLKDIDGNDVAKLTELPAPITVKIRISNEMYTRLQGKTVVILRSHTDVSGNVAVTELAATLGGTGDNYFVQFASDKFSTFALTSYEKVGGGHHGSTVTPVSVKSAPTGDAGVVLYIAMCAMSCIGSTALLCKRKEEA